MDLTAFRTEFQARRQARSDAIAAKQQAIVDLRAEAVTAERDRRIAHGVTVTDIPVQTRDRTDISNIMALEAQAGLSVVSDAGETFEFRDATNVTHSLSDAQMYALATGVGRHISEIYKAAWSIKDEVRAGTYAGDHENDPRWPV